MASLAERMGVIPSAIAEESQADSKESTTSGATSSSGNNTGWKQSEDGHWVKYIKAQREGNASAQGDAEDRGASFSERLKKHKENIEAKEKKNEFSAVLEKLPSKDREIIAGIINENLLLKKSFIERINDNALELEQAKVQQVQQGEWVKYVQQQRELRKAQGMELGK